jgi:hypothetical protein
MCVAPAPGYLSEGVSAWRAGTGMNRLHMQVRPPFLFLLLLISAHFNSPHRVQSGLHCTPDTRLSPKLGIRMSVMTLARNLWPPMVASQQSTTFGLDVDSFMTCMGEGVCA